MYIRKYFVPKIIVNIFSYRCKEYLPPPIGVQVITPPLAKNRTDLRYVSFLEYGRQRCHLLSTATAY